jgi:Raf kinase inhibitor-like YbhB/YbcL family protein
MIAAFAAAAFALTSPAFSNGAIIPSRFTCTGANVSPPLRWTAPPPGTRSLALSVQDPDAPSGTFVHWTGWNLRPSVRRLAAGARLPLEGRNSTGSRGYTGPCPPAGPAHHYVFRLYALKAKLRLRAGASPAAFRAALRGRVLATARLIGRVRGSV